jgi:hypothetical protein
LLKVAYLVLSLLIPPLPVFLVTLIETYGISLPSVTGKDHLSVSIGHLLAVKLCLPQFTLNAIQGLYLGPARGLLVGET